MADISKKSFLDRVFLVTSTDESRTLYDEWAKIYKSDMADHDFTAPQLVAEALVPGLKLNPLPDRQEAVSKITILDAGCGTGLVGVELARLGAKQVDGLDLSEGMMGVANKIGVYKNFKTADLTKTLPIADGTYDAVTCCGTFTHGHLGPEPFAEFVRVIKTSGVVVATVLDSHWNEKDFGTAVKRLSDEGKVDVVGECTCLDHQHCQGANGALYLRTQTSDLQSSSPTSQASQQRIIRDIH